MLSRLHYISQSPHLQTIAEACQAGCRLVQLRAKDLSFDEYVQLAQEAKTLTDQFGVQLIINDQVEVAKAVQAYGVHVGKEDMSPWEARRLLGDQFVIGGSTNSLDDILRFADAEVDYVGLGPFRFTTTKTNLNPVLGLEGIAKIANEVQKRNIRLPIIAIGGIGLKDINDLKQTGIYGVAMSGAITYSSNRASDVQTIQRLLGQ